eukprot:GGOE01007888.1.p1 GENE.GGOE01007888.1~~GGOE01007888.1.p1  ORF type:complete len:443 (+),score=62.37 GGOE01007888.1:126-1454(+)
MTMKHLAIEADQTLGYAANFVQGALSNVLFWLERVCTFSSSQFASEPQRSTKHLLGIAGAALRESMHAVKELKKEQIEEVRSFHNPPNPVRQAGQIIHAILEWRSITKASDIPSTSWQAVQQCLLLQVQRKVRRFSTQNMAASPVVEWLAAQYFAIHLSDAGEPDIGKLVALLHPSQGSKHIASRLRTRFRASMAVARLMPNGDQGTLDVTGKMRRISQRHRESAQRLCLVTCDPPCQPDAPQGPLTVQDVAYANQTCGLLYRWCISQFALALCARLAPTESAAGAVLPSQQLTSPGGLAEGDLKAGLWEASNLLHQHLVRYSCAVALWVERCWFLKLELTHRSVLDCEEASARLCLVRGLQVGEEEQVYRGHVLAQEAWWWAALERQARVAGARRTARARVSRGLRRKQAQAPPALAELGWKDFHFNWDDELREQWFALSE